MIAAAAGAPRPAPPLNNAYSGDKLLERGRKAHVGGAIPRKPVRRATAFLQRRRRVAARLDSRPDTRKGLLEGLADKGYGPQQLGEITSMIDADKSDIFDVLAYVAFTQAPETRAERAAASKSLIATHYDDKQQAFLDFVLAQYVSQGVEELDQDKLGTLIALKYGSAHEAVETLGSVAVIQDTFVGFQRYLYET